MTRLTMSAALLLVSAAAGAMGMTEDPLEVLTRTWTLDEVKTLEIRGQVQFELIPGPVPRVTAKTSRALFDQLSVSNWWGQTTIAIESGLRGPRERGVVQITIELPSLQSLAVLDSSSGQVTWPPGAASIRVGENSVLNLTLDAPSLRVEASWLSSVQVKGKVLELRAALRHQARLNARGLDAATVQLELDEESTAEVGTAATGTGLARHGSRILVPTMEGWKDFVLKEGAVLIPRTE